MKWWRRARLGTVGRATRRSRAESRLGERVSKWHSAALVWDATSEPYLMTWASASGFFVAMFYLFISKSGHVLKRGNSSSRFLP